MADEMPAAPAAAAGGGGKFFVVLVVLILLGSVGYYLYDTGKFTYWFTGKEPAVKPLTDEERTSTTYPAPTEVPIDPSLLPSETETVTVPGKNGESMPGGTERKEETDASPSGTRQLDTVAVPPKPSPGEGESSWTSVGTYGIPALLIGLIIFLFIKNRSHKPVKPTEKEPVDKIDKEIRQLVSHGRALAERKFRGNRIWGESALAIKRHHAAIEEVAHLNYETILMVIEKAEKKNSAQAEKALRDVYIINKNSDPGVFAENLKRYGFNSTQIEELLLPAFKLVRGHVHEGTDDTAWKRAFLDAIIHVQSKRDPPVQEMKKRIHEQIETATAGLKDLSEVNNEIVDKLDDIDKLHKDAERIIKHHLSLDKEEVHEFWKKLKGPKRQVGQEELVAWVKALVGKEAQADKELHKFIVEHAYLSSLIHTFKKNIDKEQTNIHHLQLGLPHDPSHITSDEVFEFMQQGEHWFQMYYQIEADGSFKENEETKAALIRILDHSGILSEKFRKLLAFIKRLEAETDKVKTVKADDTERLVPHDLLYQPPLTEGPIIDATGRPKPKTLPQGFQNPNRILQPDARVEATSKGYPAMSKKNLGRGNQGDGMVHGADRYGDPGKFHAQKQKFLNRKPRQGGRRPF